MDWNLKIFTLKARAISSWTLELSMKPEENLLIRYVRSFMGHLLPGGKKKGESKYAEIGQCKILS